MIIPILGGYIFGGFCCGMIFSVVYCFYSARRQRRLLWSMFLGCGWLLCAAGVILMLVTQSPAWGNNSWQEEWSLGSVGVGLGCWWVCALIYSLPRLWPRLLDFAQK